MDCYTIKKAFSWVSFGLGHRPLSICILHGLTLIKMHNNATLLNFLKRRYAASFFLTSRLTSKQKADRTCSADKPGRAPIQPDRDKPSLFP